MIQSDKVKSADPVDPANEPQNTKKQGGKVVEIVDQNTNDEDILNKVKEDTEKKFPAMALKNKIPAPKKNKGRREKKPTFTDILK